jgi:hypothetical protein
MVNKVDLETIVGFSKGEAQSAQVREETVSFRVPDRVVELTSSTLLFKLVISFSDRIRMKSTPMLVLLVEGSSVRVSFRDHKGGLIAYNAEGSVPIPSGGVVYLGFMQ